jgi:hypothetical protein
LTLTVSDSTWSRTGKVTASYLVQYELAVRAARREAYSEARALYARLGAAVRAGRMGELERLRPRPGAEASSEELLRRRYAYAAFLADNSERVFFNDLAWGGLQRYAFLEPGEPPDRAPSLLSQEEAKALLENERRFRDAQEERWQAFLLLDDVVGQAGHSELGTRAARKALECLERINTERFGRGPQIAAAKQRLVAWLREPPSHP